MPLLRMEEPIRLLVTWKAAQLEIVPDVFVRFPSMAGSALRPPQAFFSTSQFLPGRKLEFSQRRHHV